MSELVGTGFRTLPPDTAILTSVMGTNTGYMDRHPVHSVHPYIS